MNGDAISKLDNRVCTQTPTIKQLLKFGRFNVYWIQINRQTDKQSIYR